MQAVSDGIYPGQSAITFLPMIDMDPGNMSCVYSTLQFVSSLAMQYNVTPVLTFDQPLWWKSMVIIDSEPTDSQYKRCTCRKHGLECSVACGGCKGLSCSNSPSFEELDCDLVDLPHVSDLPVPFDDGNVNI